VKPDRVPFRERPHTLDQWCSCHHVWSEGKNGETIRHERLWRDPACKLHGSSVKEAPF